MAFISIYYLVYVNLVAKTRSISFPPHRIHLIPYSICVTIPLFSAYFFSFLSFVSLRLITFSTHFLHLIIQHIFLWFFCFFSIYPLLIDLILGPLSLYQFSSNLFLIVLYFYFIVRCFIVFKVAFTFFADFFLVFFWRSDLLL